MPIFTILTNHSILLSALLFLVFLLTCRASGYKKDLPLILGRFDIKIQIEIDPGFGISFGYNRKNKKGKKKKEMTTKTQEYKIDIEWNKGDSMPFELSLPTEIKKSYTGKFSKYFWILEAKLDIAWSKDLHVETDIEII